MPSVSENVAMAGRCLHPVYISKPNDFVNGWHVSALLDTGATQSAVTEQLALTLGLPRGRAIEIAASGQRATHNSHIAHLEFWQHSSTNTGTPSVFRNLELCQLLSAVNGIQLLIGMDIIGTARRFEIENGIWRLQW